MKTKLFFLAAFHAYVVFGLARLPSVILRTGPLLIATLRAARWFSLYWIVGATKSEQYQDSDRYDRHDGAPLETAGQSARKSLPAFPA